MSATDTAITLIKDAFAEAIRREKKGDDRMWEAFDVAASLGWDCEDFPDFMRRVPFLKDGEILRRGRDQALSFLKEQGGPSEVAP